MLLPLLGAAGGADDDDEEEMEVATGTEASDEGGGVRDSKHGFFCPEWSIKIDR